MADDAKKKIEDTKWKLAQISVGELWRTMGRPGDVPWWLLDLRPARTDAGGYVIEAVVHKGLTYDSGNWPYGLPQRVNGIRVVVTKQAVPRQIDVTDSTPINNFPVGGDPGFGPDASGVYGSA